MRKIVLTLATMALAFTSFAEVKYEYNEVDKFTNVHTFKTEPVDVIGKIVPAKKRVYKDVTLAAQYKDSTNLLCLAFDPGKHADLKMSSASHILIRLEDGSNVKLPIVHGDPTIDGKVYEYQFMVNMDHTAFLKAQEPTDLRLDAAAGGFDITIPEKNRPKLHELMKAMADAPSPIQLRDIKLDSTLIKKYNRM